MDTVESYMGKIVALTYDLSATKIDRYETGHYETGRYTRGGYSWDKELPEQEWIVDQPATYIPDEQKIQEAKVQLEQFYRTSVYYSVRYSAGTVLGFDDESFGKSILEQEMETWFSDLSDRIGKKEPVIGDMAIWDLIYLHRHSTEHSPTYLSISVAKRARDLLELAYDSDPGREIRQEIGLELGYSRLKLWLDKLHG